MSTIASNPPLSVPAVEVPPLCAGDRLSRDEFERRHAASPHVAKAELIEGVVYVQFAIRFDHGFATSALNLWLGAYAAEIPGTRAFNNTSIRLDLDNEPQPDVGMFIEPPHGQVQYGADHYLEGAPELVAEASLTTASYDLHDKLNAYRRNGVKEYVVWRIADRKIDWFILRGGRYEQLPPGASGNFQSEVFPGLWLDKDAMLAGDMRRVLQVVQHGIASAECLEFANRMRSSGAK